MNRPPENTLVSITVNITKDSPPELVELASRLAKLKLAEASQTTQQQEWVTEDDVFAFFRERGMSHTVAGRIWAIISLQAVNVVCLRDRRSLCLSK